ncbi:hypothetical protein EDF27_2796 [Curtobacterium sp. PhB136]|nr:hypothetical protein EDF27_2796 [Curtobacterium sp. PhB136]
MASRLRNSAKRSRTVAPSGTVAQRKPAASAAMGRVTTKSAMPVTDDARWTRNREQALEVLAALSSPELADLVEEARRAGQAADL